MRFRVWPCSEMLNRPRDPQSARPRHRPGRTRQLEHTNSSSTHGYRAKNWNQLSAPNSATYRRRPDMIEESENAGSRKTPTPRAVRTAWIDDRIASATIALKLRLLPLSRP